jgi:hypothetical protein
VYQIACLPVVFTTSAIKTHAPVHNLRRYLVMFLAIIFSFRSALVDRNKAPLIIDKPNNIISKNFSYICHYALSWGSQKPARIPMVQNQFSWPHYFW